MDKWETLRVTLNLLIDINDDTMEKIYSVNGKQSEFLTEQNKTLKTILRVMSNLEEKEKESGIN